MIAVNEQRFALGQKSVISTDQFGTIPDNNPGEFMKWLPGVSVEYFANNIVGVSVRGLDAVSTEISFDGMPVASASTATASVTGRDRNFEMRSEERRVGKECRSRWVRLQLKKRKVNVKREV